MNSRFFVSGAAAGHLYSAISKSEVVPALTRWSEHGFRSKLTPTMGRELVHKVHER